MVRAIITWSLHNRLIVILGTLVLIGAGIFSAYHLNMEAYPDPTPPLVEVITQNPGASPEEMERLIGIPLETALNGMPGLEDLRSTSVAGLNDIKCQFAYGTDYWAARQEVINRIGMVGSLPAGVQPGLSPWSPTGEIVRYVLEGPGYTLNQLKAVQDWVLNRALKTVPGVIDVTGYGGTVKQYMVLIDTRLLRQYNITLQQVEDAISRSNANIGGDILTLGSQSHNVRAVGLLGKGIDPLDPANADQSFALEVNKIEDLRKIIITSVNDNPIYLRNVAQAVVGHRPRLGIVGRGTEDDVVEGIVLMRKYERSLMVSEKVAEKMEQIEHEGILPKGMHLKVFNQRTDLIHVTTHNVLHNLIVGMALVIGILFVFLGDLASAGIVALMIPLALLFSVTVLYMQGKSANLLSIGAVDFGIIVDSSVIIVENIYRHITAHGADRSRPLIDRIIEASSEIEKALFFSTTIIICAFIPLFSMTGPEGALFGPMANTYAFAIFGALCLALTLAPVLCSFLFHNKREETDTIVDRLMKRRYLKALSQVLQHRYITLAIMVSLLIFTATLIPHLGGEFMPPLEEGNLWIRALLPRTVSLEGAARVAPRLREVMASIPEVRGVMSHIGRPDDGTDVTSFFNVEFNVPLRPMEQWRRKRATLWGYPLPWTREITREEIQDDMMEKFKEFPGVNFNFSQLIRDNVEEALSGVKGANSVKLFGTDLKTLEEAGQRVANVLQSVPGIQNVGLFHIIGQPNLEIEIDRDRCASLRRERGRRRGRRPGGNRRPRILSDGRGREALRHRASLAAPIARRPQRDRTNPDRWTPHRRRPARPADPARPTGQDPSAQARGVLHLPREQPPLHPDQVQCPGPRPRLRHRRGPGESRRPEGSRQAAAGLPGRVVGRVRPDAGGQRPADVDHPAVDRPDHGPALHRLQLDQGRASGHGQRDRGHHGRRLGAVR